MRVMLACCERHFKGPIRDLKRSGPATSRLGECSAQTFFPEIRTAVGNPAPDFALKGEGGYWLRELLERSPLGSIIGSDLQSLGSQTVRGRNEGRCDVHPLSNRARRPAGSRNDFCRWSMANCAGWPPSGSRRRSRARPCSRPPWFTRPTSGSSGRARLRTGTGAAISSPRLPWPCAASWSSRARRKRRPQARRRPTAASPPTLTPCLRAAPHRTSWPCTRLWSGSPRHDPVKAKLVEMRFFAGLTIEQAAECLGIAPRTAERAWRYARAWLYTAMGGPDSGEK